MAIGSVQPSAADFLEDVGAHAPLPPHVPPSEAAVTIVTALLHRLTPGQAHHLVMAMPAEMGPYFDAALHERQGKPIASFDRAELMADLGVRLAVTPAAAEAIAAAVFEALRACIPKDVAAHVAAQLPRDLRALWLGAGPTTELEIAETDLDARRRFLETLASRAVLPDGVAPDEAFSAVMCVLAERLSGGEAEDLLLGLPRTLRPVVMRCFRHAEPAVATFDAAELVARVGAHLQTDTAHAQVIVRAVFDAVRSVISADEVEDVASQLPPELRDLWCGP